MRGVTSSHYEAQTRGPVTLAQASLACKMNIFIRALARRRMQIQAHSLARIHAQTRLVLIREEEHQPRQEKRYKYIHLLAKTCAAGHNTLLACQ